MSTTQDFNSKNNIHNSQIHAGKDVHIGDKIVNIQQNSPAGNHGNRRNLWIWLGSMIACVGTFLGLYTPKKQDNRSTTDNTQVNINGSNNTYYDNRGVEKTIINQTIFNAPADSVTDKKPQ